MANQHNYTISLKWTGNTGKGTVDYKAFERSYIVSAEGKQNLQGSSDPAYRGDPTKWNPEELLLAALSSCHMLWYLHICATNKIVITQYEDIPKGVMPLDSSGLGQFTEATLYPKIVITDATRIKDAEKLHHEAHEKCFIARSVNFPVKIVPTITA